MGQKDSISPFPNHLNYHCGMLNNGPPTDIRNLWMLIWFGKKDFANVIKDPVMGRLSQIIRWDLMPSYVICVFVRESKGTSPHQHTHTHTQVIRRPELSDLQSCPWRLEWCNPKARNAGCHGKPRQRLGADSPLWPSEGTSWFWPNDTDVRHLASCENFFFFQTTKFVAICRGSHRKPIQSDKDFILIFNKKICWWASEIICGEHFS